MQACVVQTCTQAGRQTDRPTDRQADRQVDRNSCCMHPLARTTDERCLQLRGFHRRSHGRLLIMRPRVDVGSFIFHTCRTSILHAHERAADLWQPPVLQNIVMAFHRDVEECAAPNKS
eukprot:353808-Chlamydomonas_euryale.AAC.2